jgi:hypothetical protein
LHTRVKKSRPRIAARPLGLLAGRLSTGGLGSGDLGYRRAFAHDPFVGGGFAAVERLGHRLDDGVVGARLDLGLLVAGDDESARAAAAKTVMIWRIDSSGRRSAARPRLCSTAFARLRTGRSGGGGSHPVGDQPIRLRVR